MTWFVLGSALWLGILTAISPCPLATNITAVSYIGRQSHHRRAVLLSGLLYALGRTLSYVVLGALIMAGLLATSRVSLFLQSFMNTVLGPLLILLGMVLLGWIGTGVSLSLADDRIQQRMKTTGLLGSLVLGILFALSFCPVSAGLFFMGLIPLAVIQESRWVLPILYGVGTALPVLMFAFLLSYAATSVGKAFNRLSAVERWVRYIAGALFVLTGIYYSLVHVYEIPF